MTSFKVDVNGWSVWSQIFGSGSTPLLMIPGFVGTGTTHFHNQLYGADALDLTKFTIVCIELPGWGRSRPPARKYGPDVYINDARCCIELMKSLGYPKFFVLGWCEGCKVALLLSHLYPSAIEKVILLSLIGPESESEIELTIRLTQDINQWNPKIVDSYLRSYENRGEIQTLYDQLLDFLREYSKHFPNGFMNNDYDSIICPVLIIHGDRDPFISLDKCFSFLSKLKNGRLERFANGYHLFHYKFKREVKQIVENFLFEN